MISNRRRHRSLNIIIIKRTKPTSFSAKMKNTTLLRQQYIPLAPLSIFCGQLQESRKLRRNTHFLFHNFYHNFYPLKKLFLPDRRKSLFSYFISCAIQSIKLNFTINPAKTMETIDKSLIKILTDGPEVSLNGSPTVSPTTAAL